MESVINPNSDAIERQPKENDPQEIRIKKALGEQLLNTSWAKETFEEIRLQQLDFFRQALTDLSNPQKIRTNYLELLKKLAATGKTKVVTGVEELANIEEERGLIIVTNHLGTAKLTAFTPQQLGINIPIDKIEPFPIRHAPLAILSSQLQRPIFETAVELPSPLDQIQAATEVIVIAAGGIGRLRQLENNTSKTLERKKNALIIMYPEGGTTGKRNRGGPYDLDMFQSGAFVVAAHLNVPILPIAQYFNPNSGFELGILPLIKVENRNDHEYFNRLAKTSQTNMQTWLDSQKR